MGWPAFTAGSYRGVTRAVAHFQPSYGECIYGCKEAARRMIQSAKEVIAIVTDSLTDLDIFKDLQEACTLRRVPVYILLDQSSVTAFLQMCRSVDAHLDQLQQMRVRTITGTTYYMRSGGRITGKVHERFMLIDGIKVATGSYRFNWTDGKLNSSNLIELTGQITEKFDEEFRVLYAQSLPINPRAPLSVRNSGVYDYLKHSLASSPRTARGRPAEAACLTSTPTRKPKSAAVLPPCEPLTPDRHKKNETQSCATDENWEEQQLIQEEILAGSTSHHVPALQPLAEEPPIHTSTQTSRSMTDGDAQTNCQLTHHPEPVAAPTAAMSPLRKISSTEAPPESTLKDRLHDLTTERQRHYSSIRSKLEHMRAGLSARRELADAPNVTDGLRARGRQRAHKDCGHEPNPRLLVDCGGRGT